MAAMIFLAKATSPGRARTPAWRLALARMQRPGADAAHQESVAELHLTGGAVGKIAEWP